MHIGNIMFKQGEGLMQQDCIVVLDTTLSLCFSFQADHN